MEAPTGLGSRQFSVETGLEGSSGTQRRCLRAFKQATPDRFVHGVWNLYREETELDWAAVVPAARMQTHPSSRGGVYRVRTDEHIVTTDPNSRRYFDVIQISYADCDCAILDEARDHRYSRTFFSVGY